MNATRRTQAHDLGFTIIEVIVTMSIIGLFILGFFQAYFLLESQRVSTVRQSKASDIAAINLAKFPSRPSASVLGNCTASADMTANPTTIGQPVTSGSFAAETDIAPLNGSSSQEIRVAAVNGCDGTTFKPGPVKIISTVTYGNNEKATHVSIVQ